MKKIKVFIKVLAVSLLSLALLLPMYPPTAVYAVTYGELEAIERDYENLRRQLEASETDLRRAKDESASAAATVAALNTQSAMLDANIAVAEQLLAKLSEEILLLDSRISERYEAIRARLREQREGGTPTFFELLLSSKSMSELLSAFERTSIVLALDREQTEELNRALSERNRKKTEQESVLAVMNADRAALEISISEAVALEKKATSAANEKKEYFDELTKKHNEAEEEIYRLIKEYERQYSVPFVSGSFRWPVDGKYLRVSSPYGQRVHPITGVIGSFHKGIDIPVPTGANIYASNGGKVSIARWSNSYGYYVVINHGDGRSTLYAHNSLLKVKVGDTVKKGDVIALAGSTGDSTGPHCHFEYIKDGNPIDPLKQTNIDFPSGIYITN